MSSQIIKILFGAIAIFVVVFTSIFFLFKPAQQASTPVNTKAGSSLLVAPVKTINSNSSSSASSKSTTKSKSSVTTSKNTKKISSVASTQSISSTVVIQN